MSHEGVLIDRACEFQEIYIISEISEMAYIDQIGFNRGAGLLRLKNIFLKVTSQERKKY